MLDLVTFNEGRLAAALLRADHDLLTEDDLDDAWIEGEVDTVQTESRDQGRWEIDVSYRAVNNDETTAFPNGQVLASDNITPGEHDAYCVSVVILFDELIEGHHVILDGSHGGAGESDESHEAWMHGTITVVPLADGAETVRLALGRQRRDVMQDIGLELEKLTIRLKDATSDEINEHGVKAAFGGLARQIARAA